MGKVLNRDWFNFAKKAAMEATAPGDSSQKSPVIVIDERPPSPEHTLKRRRKSEKSVDVPKVAQKGKSIEIVADPKANRSLPGGMWDPGFTLSHKIEFKVDAAEQKVISETSEQAMAENCLEFLLRGSVVAYNLVYASN